MRRRGGEGEEGRRGREDARRGREEERRGGEERRSGASCLIDAAL